MNRRLNIVVDLRSSVNVKLRTGQLCYNAVIARYENTIGKGRPNFSPNACCLLYCFACAHTYDPRYPDLHSLQREHDYRRREPDMSNTCST